ncbi:MAG: hypothetical protein MJ238_03405, partial [Bacilli bacterium]|nr:hypothetical protein [Bacilli bacterium]
YSTSDYYHNCGFKYALLGCSVNYSNMKEKWNDASKSINYVECHDNATLFDFVNKEVGNIANEDNRLRIQNLINAIVMLAPGIPFFHAGQEIGLTKYGKDNTYNLGDDYNRFPYDILEERESMAEFLSSLANWKQANPLYETLSSQELSSKISFDEFDHCIVMRIKEPVTEIKYEELVIFFNVTPDQLTYHFDSPYYLVLGTGGAAEKAHIRAENINIPPYACLVFGKRGE